MRQVVNALIKSKKFKAIVNAKRQFLVSNSSKLIVLRSGAYRFDSAESYVERSYPQRLGRYRRSLYLLGLYDASKFDIRAKLFERYNDLTFLNTVNDVIKILALYPNVMFDFSRRLKREGVSEVDCDREIYRSPLIRNVPKSEIIITSTLSLRLHNEVQVFNVKAMLTYNFFKIISGPIKLRKFETIFSWILCCGLCTDYIAFQTKDNLIDLKARVKAKLVKEHKRDPIFFKLINQAAMLLIPGHTAHNTLCSNVNLPLRKGHFD